MERVTRLLGIGLLVGLAVLSIGNFRDTLEAIPENEVPKAVSLPDAVADEPVEDAGPPPEYLTFTAGVRSGIYDIADLPTSRDRDVTQSSRDRDFSYPIETDLVPDLTLSGPGLMTPGLYATAFGVKDCSFELRRIMKTKREAVIGEDRLKEGRMLVSINEIEPDTFSAVPQCGDWIVWSPLTEPLTVAGDGDYWIGDLKAGSWIVPTDCMWEKVVGFRGAELWDVQDSGHGPDPMVVDDETLGVRIRGCDSDFVHESVS